MAIAISHLLNMECQLIFLAAVFMKRDCSVCQVGWQLGSTCIHSSTWADIFLLRLNWTSRSAPSIPGLFSDIATLIVFIHPLSGSDSAELSFDCMATYKCLCVTVVTSSLNGRLELHGCCSCLSMISGLAAIVVELSKQANYCFREEKKISYPTGFPTGVIFGKWYEF